MKKKYLGKTKDLFTDEKCYPDLYLMHFKDYILGRNGVPDSGGNERVGKSYGKGIDCCALTSFFMNMFNKNKIHTHFIKKISPRRILIKPVSRIPIEFICRNYAYGSYLRRYPSVKPLSRFSHPLIEYTLKSDKKDDPLISSKDILKFVTRQELVMINKIIRRINSLLTKFLQKYNVILSDFKTEFGRDRKGRILLIDDFSTDTARFFLKKNNHLLSPDELRWILEI